MYLIHKNTPPINSLSISITIASLEGPQNNFINNEHAYVG